MPAKNEEKTSKPRPGKRFSSEYQPANRGRPKGKTPGTVLLEMLQQPYKEGDTPAVEAVCGALINEAVGGNVPAASVIFAYTTPKPPQEINVDAQMEIREVRRTIVRAS